MTQAAFTQLLFDIVTAVLLCMWYFPFRWLMNAEVHPLKVNILLQATYSFERSVKAVFAIAGTIAPLMFFFYLQQYLLPKFIVAGHVGIWVASAPMLAITLYYQMHLLRSLTERMEQAVRIDNNHVLQDLQARCADEVALNAQNNSLRNSQIRLAQEADAAIATVKSQNAALLKQVQNLQTKIDVLMLVQQNATAQKKEAAPKSEIVPLSKFPRPDAEYYVRITEIVEAGLLLFEDAPVSKAHAKRYLTKQNEWIVQAKSGGAIYAKVADLVRNGYDLGAKTLAKTLLYGCENDTGEFFPISPQTPENKGLSHFRTFAEVRNRYPENQN